MRREQFDAPIRPFKPTPQQLADAVNKTVADVIAHDLEVLFVGINPGLYTAAIGHHFGRPGNRFWPALHLGGFTTRVLSPFEERELLNERLGITNVVSRATARADQVSDEELRQGSVELIHKVENYNPRFVAILGVTAYRIAFEQPKASLGCQSEMIGTSKIWILPNPSGLNAHYQLPDLGRLFAELRKEVKRPSVGGVTTSSVTTPE